MTESHGTPSTIWLNGKLLFAGEAAISPFDRGFMYGDGVFETLRAEHGRVLYLQEHLERMHDAMRALRIHAELPSDCEASAMELLARNGLADQVAVVKITVSRGAAPGAGLPEATQPTVCITAQRYVPPPESTYQRGWRLFVYREGFSPPLARYKTLNYLYFSMARQAALDAGADEALILDPWGAVTETSSGSLLARTAGTWWTPSSRFQLPGITAGKAVQLLAAAGFEVEHRQSTVDDLLSAEAVWICSSLIGIMPVSNIADVGLASVAADEAKRFREALFSSACIQNDSWSRKS